MLLAWMAYSVLFGALISAGALAAERMAATWGRSQRFVWVGALVAAVAVPPIFATRPRTVARSAVDEPVGATIVVDANVAVGLGAGARTPARESVESRVARLIAASDDFMIRVWALASLAGVALIARATIALRRRRAHWRRVEMDGISVLVAPNVGPAVAGALSPCVVIPQWSLSLDPTARALMLRHEVEHIRARDPLLLFGAVATIALAPWNAALWLIVRRLRLAVEIDCDQRVLRSSVERREYGELLLTVGARLNAPLPFATSLAERRPSIERRIRAMTSIRPRHPRVVTAVCVALTAAATIAATRSPRPASLVTQTTSSTKAVAPAANSQATTPPVAPIAATSHATVPIAPRAVKSSMAPAPVARAQSIARRGPDSLTVEQIRAMIAAHHPTALTGDPDINTITLVVSARGEYVVSLAESRPFETEGRGGRGRSGGAGVAFGAGDAIGEGARGRTGGGGVPIAGDSAMDAQVIAALKSLKDKLVAAGDDPSRPIPVKRTRMTTLRGDTIVVLDEALAKLASSLVVLARDSAKQVADTKQIGDMIGMNMPALVQLIDPETIDAVKVDFFKPGQLGTTALRVFVVRQKP